MRFYILSTMGVVGDGWLQGEVTNDE